MIEEKNKGGRPKMDPSLKRSTIHFYATPEQEKWLNDTKARTGASWGEILDSLVAAEMKEEDAHVE